MVTPAHHFFHIFIFIFSETRKIKIQGKQTKTFPKEQKEKKK